MYHILATGSKGNAVIYFDTILVDCGIPYSKIEQFKSKLQIVLLTHKHTDHLNKSTLKRLVFERPSLRIGCAEFLQEQLLDIPNLDVYRIGKIYNYGSFKISPFKLYHDVPNIGYRIFKEDKKIIHATDTYTLEGITAKGYDLYAIEANYDEERIWDIIQEKKQKGMFAHQFSSMNSHLSMQQAQQFIQENADPDNHQIVYLHQSSEF